MDEQLIKVNRADFGIRYQSSAVTSDMREVLSSAFVKKKAEDQWLKDTPEVREILATMKVGILA